MCEEPPGREQVASLFGSVDGIQGTHEGLVGDRLWSFGEESVEDAFDLGSTRHEMPFPAIAEERATASRAARIARWA